MTVQRSLRYLYAVACLVLAGCVGDESPPAEGDSTPAELPEPQMDDGAYLYQLGLMRGHLLVGNALFEAGEQAAAGTHSKHPTDELYAPMETEFAARGTAGFAAQLEAHAQAVAEGDAKVSSQTATRNSSRRLARTRTSCGPPPNSPRTSSCG